MLDKLRRYYASWANGERRTAIAEAYAPIVRGFLLPGAFYYLFVTWGHWTDEQGLDLFILGGLSLSTALLYFAFRQLTYRDGLSIGRLEAIGAVTNFLMYANVVAYMLIHFEEEKLVYFVLMAVVFSTSGVTLRTTILSVVVSISTMLWFAYFEGSAGRFYQFAFIGVATSFASLGMGTLLRSAILRQIDARLAADKIAQEDSLTGIPNRRAVFEQMTRFENGETPFWLGILDLDGFKSVNDIYGHAVGDALLRAVVQRVKENLPGDVTFGRIGGDEFLLVVPGRRPPEACSALGDKILALINQPFQVSLLQLSISGTMGFAAFPSMGATAQQVYECADFALSRGKQGARGKTLIFTVHEDREMRDCIELERALREADLESEMFMHFQPQYDLAAKRYVGFEALARWNSSTLGSVRPDQFIRAAERAGMTQKVTKILFRKALDALATWPDDIGLSFNLSAQDVSDRPFIFGLVAEVLGREIRPQRVEFEITETAVMRDIEAVKALLEDLSAAGFKIALDDFGSGYSSFQHMLKLTLDKVKIDKSFVRQVVSNPASKEIVAGVIRLCANLDLKCVLEGVETEGELAILAPLGPQIIQGYLFSKPMDNDGVLALLRKDRAEAVTA